MTKYCVDTNIIVYTMNGLEPAINFMKEAQGIYGLVAALLCFLQDRSRS